MFSARFPFLIEKFLIIVIRGIDNIQLAHEALVIFLFCQFDFALNQVSGFII